MEDIILSNVNADNVINQITIELEVSSLPSNSESSNRLSYINSQRSNKYSSSNYPPYLVYVESLDGNVGNFHPMRLGKALADSFPAITNIKRRGNLIVINFKFSFAVNQFAQSRCYPTTGLPIFQITRL